MIPEWIWGVDIAVERVDLAFVARSGAFQVNHIAINPAKGAARLASLFNATSQFATVMAHHRPPLMVYVERPTGHFRNPALDHAAGVVQAALYNGLAAIYSFPVDVQLVGITEWKKGIGLGGNADKAAILQWAGKLGYEGRQDGADALGVAAFGCLECQFGKGPTHVVHREPS